MHHGSCIHACMPSRLMIGFAGMQATFDQVKIKWGFNLLNSICSPACFLCFLVEGAPPNFDS